ncbi:hypothetical protein Gpo141_00010208 [Globisporangium polare]
MDGSSAKRGEEGVAAAAFLCSPIPRDPSQVFFVEARARRQPKLSGDSFLTEPEGEEAAKVRVDRSGGYVEQLEERVLTLERERKQQQEMMESESDRSVKRQRLQIESIASSKSVQLQKEVETLQIQIERNSELHQIELKERDMQLDQLRRQLKYAVAEEEETRSELKAVTNEYSSEKLKMQKKIVELDSKLQFVESSLNEWKEKALESASQLRTVTRQSKLKIQLLEDQLEVAVTAANATKTKLREKDFEVQSANTSLAGAMETVESARGIRALNEKIEDLESAERKLKAELVDLIESSKHASVLEEKVYQVQRKLQASEEKNAQAQKRIESYMVLEESHKQFREYFEPIVSDPQSGVSLEQFVNQPVATVIQLYKARQNAFEMLFEQKSNADIQLRRFEKQVDKLQSDLISSGNLSAKLEVQAAELQQRMADGSNVVGHLQRVNEELVAILQTYETSPDEASTAELSASERIKLLDSSLKQADALIKQVETSQQTMSTPAVVKTYETRVERLEKELADAKHQNSNLTKHLEKVEMELAVFEKRLGKGEFNVETTKIVHLSVNPTREMLENKNKTSEMEKLRQDNELLRAKLEKLSGSVSDVEMTPVASESAFTTTTSYETVEGQKLLNKRLKEVFREQIQQYREAVHLLTGFKVDLKKSNGMELLRLRSVYADHEDDELLVRMEANGALELLETDFCAQINQRVFAYLTTCRSFPAFLATLTLHLFEKQTFQGN